MPLTIPTPEELAVMPWPQRQRVSRQVRLLLLALNSEEHRCYHDSDGASATTEKERQEWARQVRAEARALQAVEVYDATPDPDAAAHRAALLEALR